MFDDKYTTIKREEWDAYCDKVSVIDIPSALERLLPRSLEGCFTIRLQDPAAAGGLRAYASGLMIVEETLSSVGELDETKRANLLNSIEVALLYADEAQAMTHKIPD